jgi:uncharacterized protein YdaU (DUF1376 family)
MPTKPRPVVVEHTVKLTGLVWWIDRWRQSSAFMQMTLAEQGAYRNMLDEAFLRGGVLPNEDRILGRACGDEVAWPKLRARVLRWFHLTPEGWRNDTLDKVIFESQRRARNQRAYRERQHAGPQKRGNGAVTRR